METRNFLFTKPLRRCLKDYLSRWQSFALPRLLSGVATPLKNSRLTDALRTFLAGLAAYPTLLKSALEEALENKRFWFGGLVLMVALPLWKCHLIFDINARIDGFYYVNYAFYFHTVREYLCGVFIATGFFIAAPVKWRFRWWALPVVVFCVVEVWVQSNYDNWRDFYSEMPTWEMWMIAVSCLPPVFLAIDYLVYRKYHLRDGNLARIKGVIQSPGLSAKEKSDLLEKLFVEFENYNARV